MRLSLSLILLCALLSFANITKADLDDAFYTYTLTPTTTFKSQQMQGVVGGSFHSRAPQIYNRDLFSVQAPTWNAGCGGIDIFAGAFSVITKDEIVQMARAIAQGAPGYFFNLAIDSVCPTCGANMKELAKRLNSYTELATTSCEKFWDTALDTTGIMSTEERLAAKNNSKVANTKWFDGVIPDYGAHLSGKSSDSENGSLPASISAAEAKEAFATNVVFALFNSENAKYTDKVALGLKPAELFMTLIGRAQVDTAQDASTGEMSVDTMVEAGSAKLKTLMYGPEDGEPEELTVTKCASTSPDCVQTVPEQIAWKGVIPTYISLISNMSNVVNERGILQKMNERIDISVEQQKFMLTYPFNYIDYAKQCYIGAADTVAQLVASKAAFDGVGEVLYDLGNDALVNALNNDVDASGLVSINHIKELVRITFDAFNTLKEAEQERISQIQKHLSTQLAFSNCKDNRA